MDINNLLLFFILSGCIIGMVSKYENFIKNKRKKRKITQIHDTNGYCVFFFIEFFFDVDVFIHKPGFGLHQFQTDVNQIRAGEY